MRRSFVVYVCGVLREYSVVVVVMLVVVMMMMMLLDRDVDEDEN